MTAWCSPVSVVVDCVVGNLTRWLDRQGWPYTSDLESDYDLLFVNSWVVPPSAVRRAKRAKPGLRVAHRIDGAAADYGSNPASDRVQAWFRSNCGT